MKRFELSTLSLARRCSTTELHPRVCSWSCCRRHMELATPRGRWSIQAGQQILWLILCALEDNAERACHKALPPRELGQVKGQVTVPQAIPEAFGLRRYDRLSLEVDNRTERGKVVFTLMSTPCRGWRARFGAGQTSTATV